MCRLPGIHISVAIARQRAWAGDWSGYAAEVSRRAWKDDPESTHQPLISTRFLTVLGPVTGMKHMPTGAFSSVLMRISFSPLGQDRPAKRLRLEPGQAGEIVRVNDDVVESDGHAGSMRGTQDLSRKPAILPRTVHHRRSRHATAPRLCNPPDPAAAREPSQLSTWPGGKAITESQPALAHPCKISAVLSRHEARSNRGWNCA